MRSVTLARARAFTLPLCHAGARHLW